MVSWWHGGCVCCWLMTNERDERAKSSFFVLLMMEILDLDFAATTGDWDADQHIAGDNGQLLIAAEC
jgi:hypothetical protein